MSTVRRFETLAACAYPAALAIYANAAWPSVRAHALVLPLALALAILTADLISGFFHWLFDTFGSPETPIVGPMWIRTFREHHADPTAIVRHDFVETNGANLFAGVVAGAPCLLVREHALLASSFVFLSIAIGMTSQIHKWAHAPAPPRAARLLQRAGLILSREHHAVHHEAPHVRHYCITAGALDAILERADLFRALERAIRACTPRPRRCLDRRGRAPDRRASG